MTLSAVLSALGLAPKTLPQARETIDGAKATLDSVNTLFSTAGLNLEQLLAAGPDSLKAHLESLDNATELAAALQENERLQAEHLKSSEALTFAQSVIKGHEDLFASLGVSFTGNSSPHPDVFKTAFDTHLAKQVTLALAKTGHPPVAHVDTGNSPAAALSPQEHYAAWKAMEPGEARDAYFAKHGAAIWEGRPTYAATA